MSHLWHDIADGPTKKTMGGESFQLQRLKKKERGGGKTSYHRRGRKGEPGHPCNVGFNL